MLMVCSMLYSNGVELTLVCIKCTFDPSCACLGFECRGCASVNSVCVCVRVHWPGMSSPAAYEWA